MLIQTRHGNILWDLIAYLDEETVDKISSLGGLSLILISHPHFYTTWADWSRTFSCPVYLSKCDAEIWANRLDAPGAQPKLLTEIYTEILPGATAAICGGHFDGSMVLLWEGNLFVADTVFTVAASQNPDPGRPDVNSYSFLYAIPNFVPLDPDSIMRIWRTIKPFEFHTTWGNVVDTMVVREKPGQRMSVKARVLESAKIAVRRMGWREHPLLLEKV